MSLISLKILIFLPLVFCCLFLTPIFSGHSVLIRRLAKTFSAIIFLYSLLFFIGFNQADGINFSESLKFLGDDWLDALGISLSFGLDSLSLVMILLTTFLTLIVCMASKGVIKSKHSLYYALIFLLEFAVLGVFSAQDIFEFFMFWELELIPTYFLISLWGEGKAKKSAMQFLLYTFGGSIFMLCGFLMLYNFHFISTSQLTGCISELNFDYDVAPIHLQLIASILIFIGFAVKLPVIPLHSWLPKAHVDAPTPISILLAGLLLKMGAYGILRFNIQLLPDPFLLMLPYLIILAFINIIFASILAYRQNDIKRIIAYSSISAMGIILLGLCSLTSVGITGAIFLMLAHGVVSAGLFFIVGVIYERTKTREIFQLGGIASVMPRFSAFSLVIVLSAVGLPGLMLFVGEFLTLWGAFNSTVLNNYLIQVVALTSVVVIVLSVAYCLRFFHKVYYDTILERFEKIADITNNEALVLFSITIVLILFGCLPMTLIDTIKTCITTFIGAFGG